MSPPGAAGSPVAVGVAEVLALRGCRPSFATSSPGPTGAIAISASSSSLERACLRESLILPIGSTAMILTVTSSPSLTTSVVSRTR